MSRNPFPFPWAHYESVTGRPVPAGVKARLQRVGREPTEHNWRAARSIVVAPQVSIMGQTLWQCVEAVTLTKYPDERTPTTEVIVRAMCYAIGWPLAPYTRR